ncbi:PAS/PAC sensor signal transduction histidine kinase (plasmid) [Emticicia oligotrophica DSM 17448]|uniref:histidine kinase n=2 Tax=Emticicia TaxID=312278 RepID=A0ABM5N7X7_EMTOG|nr:PAS domain S-box protein [Emticicia oligotrophica]AFK05569.1 PAS/PAC sensor signal transduction histidine kinase [Emticicia oligotrophica DSM 17448]
MSQTIANNIFKAFPLPSLLIYVDPSFTIQNVNDAFLTETNMTAENVVGKPLNSYFTEKRLDFTALEQSLLQVITTKQTNKIQVKTTSEQEIELENIPILDENKQITLIIQSYKFLMKTNQENSRNELDLLKKYTKEPYAIIDTHLSIISFNHQFAKQVLDLLGKDLKLGMSILDLALPERREAVNEKYKFVLQGNRVQLRPEVSTSTGSLQIFNTIDEPIFNELGDVKGVFITIQDQTDFFKLDKKQKEQEAHFKALIENTPDLIYSIDLNFNLITFNSSLSNLMLALKSVKLEPGMSILKHFGEHKREKYSEVLKKVINNGRCIFEDEFIFNNEMLVFNVAVNPIFNENKQLIGVTILSKNITQQKQLKKKEEEQRAEYRALVDNMSDAVYSLDMNLNLITFNKAMVKASIYLIGQPPQKGMNLIENFAFDKKDLLRTKFREASEGKAISFVYEETIFNESQIFEVYINPIINDDAVQTGYSVHSKVVTESVKAEKQLVLSNERYNLVTQATSDAIWDWDLMNHSFFVGGSFEKIFGHTDGNGLSSIDSWRVYLHPEDAERVLNGIHVAIESDAINWKDEYRYQKADGKYAYVLDKGFILRDNTGKAIRMVGAMQDITERNEREQQLKLFESVVINANDAILITEPEPFDEPGPKIMYANKAFTKMTGYEVEEIIGKTPRILQGPKSDFKELARLSQALRKWESCEVTTINYKKNGEEFWVNFTVTPVANEKGWFTHWIAISRDITEKVNYERDLVEANNKVITTLESIRDGFYSMDKNWIVTYWNKEMELLTEIKRTDIIGKNLWEQFPFMLDTKFYIEYKKAVAENVVVRFEEYLTISEQWFEANAFPSENGLTVFIRDITERKLNEQKIKSERKLLRTLIDNLPDSIFFKDTNARKLISNKVDLRLQGVSSEEEVIGKTDAEIYIDKPSSIGYEQDLEILRTGKAVMDHEESFMSNEGQLSWYLTSKMLVYDDDTNEMGILGIGRDITERKLAEQKLEAVNNELQKKVQQLLISNAELEQFAYVASHDLQEPLRMITSFLSQIERKYKDVIDEKGKQYIYFAVDGAKRMRQIILDLLEFSRVGRMEDKQELVNLNDLVNDILILYRKQIQEKKAIIHLDTLPTVKASKSSMRQVFQNLISNSLKYVSTEERVVPQIKITVESVNNEWMMAIKDNGIGIDSQYFDKIFIIFQRLHNKDDYSGTGIGLAITKK